MRTNLAIAILLALTAACAPEDESRIGQATYATITHNGRYLNGVEANGIAYNGILYNGIAYNGMNLGNGIASVDLADPLAHQFVEYLVSCVLPEDETVEAGGEIFAGGIGLAPEWADGACDEDCQRWASACLLARVNAKGEHVQLSMRGPHPALHPAAGELREFGREEGTYFGNLFRPTQARLASSARDDLTLPRSCGEGIGPGDGCYVDILGHSDDVCAVDAHAEGRKDCRDGDGAVWSQAITVYLR